MGGITQVVALSALAAVVRAGFYADNGLDRTISYRSLPKQEKREMENEILNLLGLDHRPMPKIHQTSNSAPKYLIDLYNQLDPEAEDRNASFRDVDFVVSFVNHHNNLDDELSIEPKLRFDVSDISPQETVMHAALNLFRRDTRKLSGTRPDIEDTEEPSSIPVGFPVLMENVEDSPESMEDQVAEDSQATSLPVDSATLKITVETITPPLSVQPTDASSVVESVVSEDAVSTSTAESPVASSTANSLTQSTQKETVSSESSTTQTLTTPEGKGRKTRSISLDYPDGFTFFDQPFEVQVFCMRHGNSIGDIALEAVANYTVGANETGWIRLNATNPLLNWVAFPGENFGLVVRLIDPVSGLQLSPSQVGLVMGATGEFAPFMAAFMKEGSGGRRRSTRASDKSRREKPPVSHISDDVPSYEIRHHFSRRNSCQKRTLYVSFRDLGWADWIIAPDGFSAFYCDGECSFPLNMNATNHAIVQTLVHLVSPSHAPTACCAPTKLSPIMVLYFDDNSNVILKKYKNMVVRSCGCH